MADNALKAKQRAAEKLARQLDAKARQLDVLQKQGTSDKLRVRATWSYLQNSCRDPTTPKLCYTSQRGSDPTPSCDCL